MNFPVSKIIGHRRLILQSSRAANRIVNVQSIHSDFKNILPTYHFQKALPRLPIPEVDVTLNKYLTSLRALEGHPNVSASDIYDAEQAVNRFRKFEAGELQKVLIAEDKANKHTSYITGPWFDMYLESRLPLPLNYNPFMLFKPDPSPELNHQTTRATNIIVSALKFKKQLDAQTLAPEVFYTSEKAKSVGLQRVVRMLPSTGMMRYIPMMKKGAYPLDMSQFNNLLSSTRIPEPDKDRLKTYPDSKHVLVLCQGEFYKLRVLDDQDNIINPYHIRNSLNHIKYTSSPLSVESSIAHLTTTDRDTWADARKHLRSLGNEEALRAIDSAIFCLVLEPDSDTTTASGSVRNFLHGDARWYDKSFSLIVARNGDTALNFEHAWGDGVAVVRFFNDVYRDSTLEPSLTDVTNPEEANADNSERIDVKVDARTLASIATAKRAYDVTRYGLYAASGLSSSLNKSFLKQQQVSPDGVIQLAIQIGYMYLHGHPAPTYESCSTSAFKHGRTETVRSCTIESVEAASYIWMAKMDHTLDSRYVSQQAVDLIKKSCAKHNTLTREAAMGHGFDRHLFALKHAAEVLLGRDRTPDLFLTPTYKLMNHIILSTSTLSSDAIQFGGFAPVTPDGYGIGYGVRDDGVGVNVTSYRPYKAEELSAAIVEAYGDIYTVFNQANPPQSS